MLGGNKFLLNVWLGYLCPGENQLNNNYNKITLDVIVIYSTKLFSITILIISITKFPIMIDSPHVFLSRNRRAITWVSDLNFL